jgi:hypothetical protein
MVVPSIRARRSVGNSLPHISQEGIGDPRAGFGIKPGVSTNA